jgi:hypothetical protein
MFSKCVALKASLCAVLICLLGTFAAAVVSAPADLIETSVIVTGTAVSGGTLAVTDTIKNQGGTDAGSSYTQIWLSSNGTTKGTFLGVRFPAGLAVGASATATTNVTVPSNLAGTYFVMVCANGNNAIVESTTANNCGSAAFTVAAPNLTETVSVDRSTVLSGGTIQVTDTLANIGAADANGSYTQIFLSTNGTTKGTFLGYRYPSALKAGLTAAPVTTTATIPTNVVGANFVMVCANGNNAVVESNYGDNCASVPVTVLSASATVIVDPTKVATPYVAASCGTATAACQTIADGVIKATPGQTVLVSPGTYLEQITITKNISLVSSVKNLAIIDAPANTKLIADADGQAALVTVSGGATSVTVKDMFLAGPMFADSCADTMYGIYVKNANATITGNKIDAIRQANSNLWGCQPGVGIRFGSRALAYVGHTGTIAGNIITGPAKAGVVVDGTNTNVNVTGNTVTGLLTTGIIGQNGIQISRGAKGSVDSNTVSGFTYGATFSSLSAAGILVYDATGGVTVTNNVVSGNDEGIGVYTDPAYDSSSNPLQVATTTAIKNNKANGNVYLGIHIDPFSIGNTIWNNTVTGNVGGWDELDEHPDFNSNNWGTDPSNVNSIGTAHAGLVFSY